MRETSVEAYHYIRETGILGEARTKTYLILYAHGPMAQFEFEGYEHTKHYGGTLSKRVNELEEMGLARDVGRKLNPLSGRECIVWDVTLKIPAGPYKPKPRRIVIAAEREACARLADEWGSPMVARAIRSRG